MPLVSKTTMSSTSKLSLLFTITLLFLHFSSGTGSYTGLRSVRRCLDHARNISSLFSGAIIRQATILPDTPATYTPGAEDDCRELSQLIVDDLQAVWTEWGSSASALNDRIAGRVESLMSATVTNLQTCIDGLEAAGGGAASSQLFTSLGDALQLYSNSLGLVSQQMPSRRGWPLVGARWVRERISTLTKAALGATSNRGRNLSELIMDGVRIKGLVTVSPLGGANFTTIADAVASAPNRSSSSTTDIGDDYFVIYVQQGYYEENVVVDKHKRNVLIIGDGINQTVVAGSRSVVDGWTTYNSATFVAAGQGFIAIDMSFKNTAGPEKHQAVAVRNSADLSIFLRCSFEGYQDTLYAHSKRQFYRDCHISGTVDFIFGNSAAVFQNCRILARRPLPNQKNTITAQSRSFIAQATGFSFQNCSVAPAQDLAADITSGKAVAAATYMGRPWKAFSRTVYMQSDIDGFIDPLGWLQWNETAPVDQVFYGEFENRGAGGATTGRVTWPGWHLMSRSEAVKFTLYNLTMADTWLPTHLNIPYTLGLLP